MKCTERKRCFAQDAENNCEILSDTHFMRSCPFWKPPKPEDDIEFVIEGYEGRFKKIKGYSYFVSTEGIVLNKFHKPKKAYFDKSKCEMRVGLTRDGREKHFRVSALVAGAFLPGEGRVYHKNGNKRDCRLENLERRE